MAKAKYDGCPDCGRLYPRGQFGSCPNCGAGLIVERSPVDTVSILVRLLVIGVLIWLGIELFL
ncbi:MAG: hypothetical protein P8Y95_04990 [Gammaproteobacteria bacterium]